MRLWKVLFSVQIRPASCGCREDGGNGKTKYLRIRAWGTKLRFTSAERCSFGRALKQKHIKAYSPNTDVAAPKLRTEEGLPLDRKTGQAGTSHCWPFSSVCFHGPWPGQGFS